MPVIIGIIMNEWFSSLVLNNTSEFYLHTALHQRVSIGTGSLWFKNIDKIKKNGLNIDWKIHQKIIMQGTLAYIELERGCVHRGERDRVGNELSNSIQGVQIPAGARW